MIPAMNSLPIDRPAMTPTMMKVALGGISGPSAPPASSAPRPYPRSYPWRSNSGTATLPTTMIVAALVPRVAASTPSPMMPAATRPPLTLESQLLAALNTPAPIPDDAMIVPSSTNSGSAVHERLKAVLKGDAPAF